MEDKDFTKTAGIAAAAVGSLAVLSGFAYCMNRLRNPKNGLSGSEKPNPDVASESNNECDVDLEAELVATTKSDSELNVDSAVASLPPPHNKHFLEKDEVWERALYLFPGLVRKSHTSIGRRVETVISELLQQKVTELREQDDGRFEILMKRENAVDLCIALGLNKTVVRKRYEAISNVQREFNIVSKTPTLISIQHLIRRIGVDNPFGEQADMDGCIREDYKSKKGLSYLGVKVKMGEAAEALNLVKHQLEHFKYSDSYVHGTTATALLLIHEKSKGRLAPSTIDMKAGGERHDFGGGFYCFKGELKYALSFAIDRCWPIFEEETFSKHNPAVILFPKPHQFNKRKNQKDIYQVGKKKPFKDEHLKNHVLRYEDDYEKFKKFERGLNQSDSEYVRYWKEFLKLSRYFGEVPDGQRLFFGWLHNCEATALTDICKQPRIDEDRWVQYCFTKTKDLGDARLFIELNVDWNEWIDKIPPDASNKTVEETVKAGKKKMEKEVKDVKG